MNGWIKMYRSIQDNFLWNESREKTKFEAWVDILLNVNHKPQKVLLGGQSVEVKRGESVYSLDTWANRWKWDKSKVRRFLNMLKKEEMIELKPLRKSTHLSVCNYDTYQSERHSNDTQMTPNKKVRKKEVGNTKEKLTRGKAASEDEVVAYCVHLGLAKTDGEYLWEKWEANGWINGKNRIKDWQGTIRSWKKAGYLPSQKQPKMSDYTIATVN